MLVKVNGEDFDVQLLEAEDNLIILVDDEPFKIVLGNETHDNLGRFASRAGSAVKKVGAAAKNTVGKGVVKSAIGGAAFGAVSGAIGGAVKGNREEGTAMQRAKKGLIKGAIRGAKMGALRKLVSNTLDLGASRAGSYGWAVRAVGGMSIAVVGKKKGLGLEPGDVQAIGREMFAKGFSEFVAANLELEPVYLEEGDFKGAVGQLAMMIADFLETSEEEYMGVEDGAGYEDLGFVETEGVWYIHREDAEDLLASLLSYGEEKLETFDRDSIKLYNKYHDAFGRFATAQNFARVQSVATNVGRVAGIAGFLIDYPRKKRISDEYRKKYGEETSIIGAIKNYKRNKARVKEIADSIQNETVFSKKIGGREIKVTYGQLDRAQKKVGMINKIAGGINMGITAGLLFKQYKDYKNQYQNAREQAEREWEERERRRTKKDDTSHWPPEASEQEFKNMYRKLAKKFHPDTGGTTAGFQELGNMYERKDWKGIKDLYDTIGLEANGNYDEVFVYFIQLLKESLANGDEYLVIPLEDGDEVPDGFIKIEDEAVMDRITMRFLVNLFDGLGDDDAD